MTSEALPDVYRITSDCFDRHGDDTAAALLCSSGSDEASEAYGRFKEVNECIASEGEDAYAVAGCLGDETLGDHERYYLRCVTDNKADLETSAVCALSKDLTPEQQIALGGAVQSGGNPKLFALCTGGKLTARELEKCWENGIGTDTGCFGPNNELRKAANFARDRVCDATGNHSVTCDAYTLWHDNVLAPGPNHEVVKILNNSIGDLRDGPGENNEFVKIGKGVEEGFQSIGSVLGF